MLTPEEATSYVIARNPDLDPGHLLVPQVIIPTYADMERVFGFWANLHAIGGYFSEHIDPDAVFISPHSANADYERDSILVHETAHFLQHKAGTLENYYDPIARHRAETQAYRTPLQWLLDNKDRLPNPVSRSLCGLIHAHNLAKNTGNNPEVLALGKELAHFVTPCHTLSPDYLKRSYADEPQT